MNKVQQLVGEVANARTRYLDQLHAVPASVAQWKPAPEEWSVTEITEHLFWAEQGALFGMWKTLQAIRQGALPVVLQSIHRAMPVEQIIELTWQTKEVVPAVAAPRLGGTLPFWMASLQSLQQVLNAFGNDLQDQELRWQAHPHPISGAMDFQQRIGFLRFHIHRHAGQVARVLHPFKTQ